MEWWRINLGVDWAALQSMIARLALDLAFATILVRCIYKRLYGNRDCVFTYYLLNVITFFLCLLLSRVQAHVGMALALFGVFGILRYRTEQIPVRDLTYLFVVIGMGVLNAIASSAAGIAELVVVNGVIVILTAGLEFGTSKSSERSTPMLYDQLELLRPGNEERLVDDIREKTGLTVVRVEVNRVDLLRDAAELTVVYRHVRPRRIATPLERLVK